MTELDQATKDQLFLEARTHYTWLDRPIDEAVLRRLYDLAKFPPTSANGQPARYVFVTSAEAKDRLRPALSASNVEKTMAAPVCAIIAYDTKWYEQLPRTLPHADARSWFAGNAALIAETGLRNSSLSGAYLMLAARTLGLDVGPMSGFDAAKLDAEFFPDGAWRSNFLCNIGYGDPAKGFPRNLRLPFDEVCRIL